MSNYTRQADGGVAYTGAPEDYSSEQASAVARGLELGSEPAPTGDPEVEVTEEKASARRRPNPPLEQGVAADFQVG